MFQTYGLSNNIDAHMLTNLEWGAIAYLTHSIYGLCNDGTCRDAYINNSSDHYTGRSGGAIAGSDSLQLTNFYGSGVTTSTNMYNANGYYNYKGYKINNDGTVTTIKDTSKVSSTTGNITGMYDMSGGSSEYVMGNMVKNTFAFFPSESGTNWNGSITLDTKYYNGYSYGMNSSSQSAFNRGRLGDATAEVTGSSGSDSDTWKPGSGIVGAYSHFVSNSSSWFIRGGYYGYSFAGSFNFTADYGANYTEYSFRSSLK